LVTLFLKPVCLIVDFVSGFRFGISFRDFAPVFLPLPIVGDSRLSHATEKNLAVFSGKGAWKGVAMGSLNSIARTRHALPLYALWAATPVSG
jgi:hypothetical protein